MFFVGILSLFICAILGIINIMSGGEETTTVNNGTEPGDGEGEGNDGGDDGL